MLKDIKLKETMLDEVDVNKQKERAIKQARNIESVEWQASIMSAFLPRLLYAFSFFAAFISPQV